MKRMFNLVASALVAIHLTAMGLNFLGERGAKSISSAELQEINLASVEYAKMKDEGIIFKVDGKFFITDSSEKELFQLKVSNTTGFSEGESSPLFNAALTWILIFSFAGIATRKRSLAS